MTQNGRAETGGRRRGVVRAGAGRLAAAAVVVAACGGAEALALTEDRVLLLYNSANAESLAVRELYVAAHPGVLQLDLADSTLAPGSISRDDYLTKIRAPLLAYLNNGSAFPRSQQVIAIATTRGLPARINGKAEFNFNSTWSSVESELALMQQNLEAAGAGQLPTLHHGVVDNPYHLVFDAPIESISRANIETLQTASQPAGAFWRFDGLTPGDIYLVCRLDAAPDATRSAVANVAALIQRSQNLVVSPCKTQALLDEYACSEQLDDDGFVGLFTSFDDFDRARINLGAFDVSVLHDETFAFFEGHELPDQSKPLLVIGTYGENHKIDLGTGVCGENPVGQGTYISTYAPLLHPAAMFIAYESFGGNSIVDGMSRGNQGQALDFIAGGGSFTIATVAEPFTFAIADLELLTENMIRHGLTFAEAAYSALPGLSWQSTPIGDPLARLRVINRRPGDLNGDDVVNASDLAILLGAWASGDCAADFNGDGIVNATDLGIILGAWG